MVGKNQFGRFEGATTNKLVVQENWSYVGRRTIVGCKFDAKMANQLYEQLFPCGAVATLVPVVPLVSVVSEVSVVLVVPLVNRSRKQQSYGSSTISSTNNNRQLQWQR